jgi:hypothetical protein
MVCINISIRFSAQVPHSSQSPTKPPKQTPHQSSTMIASTFLNAALLACLTSTALALPAT